MTTACSMAPYGSKAACSLALSVSQAKPPTNSFFDITLSCGPPDWRAAALILLPAREGAATLGAEGLYTPARCVTLRAARPEAAALRYPFSSSSGPARGGFIAGLRGDGSQ
jgi:hypothetical protein